MRPSNQITPVLLGLFVALAGCGDDSAHDEPPCELQLADEDGEPFDRLTDYCFFRGDPAGHEPSDGVVPYEPTAELYSDRSRKQRFIVLPDGEQIGFDERERWDWPEGTTLIKTFYYPHDERDPAAGRRILETRLLVKRHGAWESENYRWNDEQTEAHHDRLGGRVDVEFVDEHGDDVQIDYRIPNDNQCSDCHAQDGDLKPLGPRTRQLTNPYGGDEDLVPQLEAMDERQMFDTSIPDVGELPAVTDPHDESAPLDDRARSYLDANCAHCHNPEGKAASSNLFLDVDETNDTNLGICKTPVAAGHGAGGRNYDIVPGEPDESILVFRMETLDPEIKMPELPITTVDEEGVDLVRDWIAAMDHPGCD